MYNPRTLTQLEFYVRAIHSQGVETLGYMGYEEQISSQKHLL